MDEVNLHILLGVRGSCSSMHTSSMTPAPRWGRSQSDWSTSLPRDQSGTPATLHANPSLYIYTHPHTTRAHGRGSMLFRLNSREVMYVEQRAQLRGDGAGRCLASLGDPGPALIWEGAARCGALCIFMLLDNLNCNQSLAPHVRGVIVSLYSGVITPFPSKL